MDFQLAASLILLSVACGYLLITAARGWKRLRQGKCGTGCGCSPKPKADTPTLIQTNDLTARLHRKRG